MDQLFEAKNLTKTYGVTNALDGVNLQFPRGSVVGLIGPNGSGKTTLMLHATGQILPSQGECQTFGVSSQSLGAAELSRIGVVHQADSFLPWMTVRQQLTYVGSFYSRWDQQLEDRLLRELELDRNAVVKTLSPGNAQKLAVVLAVCHRPELLLLDEPVSALDPLAREAFFRFLFELLADGEPTVVVSSHGLHDIERLVDRIICLNQGKVRADASLDDLKDAYAEWFVTAPGDLPAEISEPFVLTQSRNTRQARLIVRNAESYRQKFAERYRFEVTTRPLKLEEIYPYLLAGE